MASYKDKVRGTFLGIAIGDALGKPVEMMKPADIAQRFGRIDKYLDCSSHKYFQNDHKGTTTDDWQLTKAVAKGFISTGEFDLDAIATEHCKEFAISVRGWGGSTREAVARLVEGEHWSTTGKTEIANRGTGNGVCMKVTPVGIFLAFRPVTTEQMQKIADLSTMTHNTSIAVSSGLAHTVATMNCLANTPETFNKKNFLKIIRSAVHSGNQYLPDTLKDNLQTRFDMLEGDLTPEQIIDPATFGGGSCYVYDSLPFTYAWFLRNPNSIETLYDCVSGGGDADSNGSMVAGLLGSLHGTSIFPKELVDGLKDRDEVIDIADQFSAKFLP